MDEHDIPEAIEDCCSALDARNCPFTAWEKEFVESIYEQWDDKGWLSERQKEVLQKIWNKV